jgi:hypothetical protein
MVSILGERRRSNLHYGPASPRWGLHMIDTCSRFYFRITSSQQYRRATCETVHGSEQAAFGGSKWIAGLGCDSASWVAAQPTHVTRKNPTRQRANNYSNPGTLMRERAAR